MAQERHSECGNPGRTYPPGGWIGVEVFVIRTFSWLQPTLLVVGLGLTIAGYRGLAKVHRPSTGGGAR